MGNPSENQERGVTGSQGTRCINSAVSIRPPIPASPARTQGAVLIGGASVPHSFTDRCECPHEESLIARHGGEGVSAALLIPTARPQWHVV